MTLGDWLVAQLTAPGALLGGVQLVLIAAGFALVLGRYRAAERHRMAADIREAMALAELADHVTDLVLAVSDAFADEVSAQDFVEGFDPRQLVDAQLMLEAVRPRALPSLGLIRPLFELVWAVDAGLAMTQRIKLMVDDPSREGWRQSAGDMAAFAERAAIAAEAFRDFARRVG